MKPDYDLTEKNRVKVTLYGKIIDENYSKLLFEKANLNIDQVILLDKVQKKYPITKAQSDYLRKDKLIEGRYPNIYISSDIAKVTGEKESYIYNSGLENDYYKSLIMKYITKYGKASRKELENLLKDKLPATLSDDNKVNRIRYLLKMLRKEKKIYNDKSENMSCWKIVKKQFSPVFLRFSPVFLRFSPVFSGFSPVFL